MNNRFWNNTHVENNIVCIRLCLSKYQGVGVMLPLVMKLQEIINITIYYA